ncbi:hypothetical protein OAQ75_02945 [Gammaproteobacteria bacterium]|jgi:hypothetical protein|nr:hypothetical protein [Gammaproteobacteria bacterium]MDC0914365.1 hypothetical protein [Gammaproteobacteria bacterium]MDC1021678.1 hypothetical protein [Gammaproteobacteria bacterium]
MEIIGLFVIGVAVYGYIILKREGKEIGPNSKGRGTFAYIFGSFGQCIGAGTYAVYYKIKNKK